MSIWTKLTQMFPLGVIRSKGTTVRALLALRRSDHSATCHVNNSQQVNVASLGLRDAAVRNGVKGGKILSRLLILARYCAACHDAFPHPPRKTYVIQR